MGCSCKVSVVVPVYNRQNLIKRCLGDIINQSMPREDYEVIVVDDRSTDGTYGVVEGLARECPGLIRTFQTQRNTGGPSAGRNIGIEEARGEYLLFLDSDDRFEPDLLQNAHDLARQGDSDLVLIAIGSFRERLNDFQPRDDLPFGSNVVDFDIAELAKPTQKGAIAHIFKLFRRSILLENNIRFDTRFRYGEDALFLYTYLMCDSVRKTSLLADKIYIKMNYLADSPDSTGTAGHLAQRDIPADALFGLNRELFKLRAATPQKQALLDKLFTKRVLMHLDRANRSLLPKSEWDEEYAEHTAFEPREMHPQLFDEMSRFVRDCFPPEYDKLLNVRDYFIVQALRAGDREAMCESLDKLDRRGGGMALSSWQAQSSLPPINAPRAPDADNTALLVGLCRSGSVGAELSHWALSELLKSAGMKVRVAGAPDQLHMERRNCRYFVTAAGQLWNPRSPGVGFEPHLWYLACGDSECKKVSVATSFGAFERAERCYNPVQLPIARQLLSQFDFLSVREQTGVHLLSGMGIGEGKSGTPVRQLLDPVFLLPLQRYDELTLEAKAGCRANSSRYVFAYARRYSKGFVDFCVRAQEAVAADEIVVMATVPASELLADERAKAFEADGRVRFCRGADVSDFLYNIKNAAYVVSASYYGACFAAMYERAFTAAMPCEKSRQSRFKLFADMGYGERLVALDGLETAFPVLEPVPGEEAERGRGHLNRCKFRSFRYLEKAFERAFPAEYTPVR